MDVDVTNYTEYMVQIETGAVTVQVPNNEDLPVQIIINTGKTVIFGFEEFQAICAAVAAALEMSGRELIKEEERGG